MRISGTLPLTFNLSGRIIGAWDTTLFKCVKEVFYGTGEIYR